MSNNANIIMASQRKSSFVYINSISLNSKTVTWADDPYNRYKKDDAEPQFYDSDNIDNSSSNHIYTDEANQLQQYQTTDPNNYVDIVETTNPANSCVYQYNLNQNLYHSQVDASDQNESENQGYYYADSDQNGIDQQMQPEQQVYKVYFI